MSTQWLDLLKRDTTISIYASKEENSAVKIAVGNLIGDIVLTCGCKAVLSDNPDECSIIIHTLTEAKEWELLQQKELSISKLRKEDDSLYWEGFLQEVKEDKLYIIGTNRRGTIYGIYDLCEQLGVSPWYYWGDVPVKKKDVFRLPENYSHADWPSVEYRGIFINDEEELDDWAKLHTPDGTIGPTAYEKIFELLLRLKANYIWPAMHVNYFNGNLKNGALADKMGIVVGTSHCDMLLRSNQNEWKPWIKSKGYEDAVYDYSIKGKNRDILKEYWKESIEQNQNYEVCYTMGMRGIHDSGFHTKAIDEDETLGEEEKNKAKVKLLGDVIKDQRELLKEVLGEEAGAQVLTTFIPYKEVLSLYDGGLEVPEDITLIWANDNFGHVRRYPSERERNRKGGNGLYFHNSYWAAPGTAMSYLFINSIPLAHTGNELKKAYESGIRKLWILNIGGLKPLEQDMEFFITYGWEAGKETGITKNTMEFTAHWINSNFSGNHGEEAAKLYEIFAGVTNVRKIEHMNNHVFSQTAYGDEAGRRLMQLEDIYRRGNQILFSLPKEEQEAFFQLFLMKIHASYYTNHEFYYADRSILSFERGNMQAADKYTDLSIRMTDFKRRMIHFYNKKMCEGKWDKIMTPENFPPPPTSMHPIRKKALVIKGSELGIALWNEEPNLTFSLYGRKQKWIELGNLGAGEIPFSIEVEEGSDWIVVSETEGVVKEEKRILITANLTDETIKNRTVEESAEKETIQKDSIQKGIIHVWDQKNNKKFLIEVIAETEKIILDNKEEVKEEREAEKEAYQEDCKEENTRNNQAHKKAYIESDDAISFMAAGYHTINSENPSIANWIEVPGIGRGEGSAMMAWNKELRPLEAEIERNPYMEYTFYLKTEGKHNLETHRFLTLNSTGRIRFAVSVDGQAPFIVESDTKDEWTGKWKESVFDNGEKLITSLPFLEKGFHSLRIYMIDYYVTLSKFVLYTSIRKENNLGPVSSHSLHHTAVEYGLESPEVLWNELEELAQNFYKTKEEEVPPYSVSYVTSQLDKTIDKTFEKCYEVSQKFLGPKKYAIKVQSDGSKNLINEFGQGIFLEEDGKLAIEAEYALEQSDYAYLTPDSLKKYTWSHLQAETNGRDGFAMHVEQPNLLWEEPEEAPGMHYKIQANQSGTYHIWLLVRHYNFGSDSCYVALDGKVIPLSEQLRKGNLHTYNTAYVYHWCQLADIAIEEGEHLFSILARKSQLRVDRIYLTTGEELPPIDALWQDSKRKI